MAKLSPAPASMSALALIAPLSDPTAIRPASSGPTGDATGHDGVEFGREAAPAIVANAPVMQPNLSQFGHAAQPDTGPFPGFPLPWHSPVPLMRLLIPALKPARPAECHQ